MSIGKSNRTVGSRPATMRTGKRRIRRGIEYERFFKPAKGKNITVKKEARLEDTMKWIKYVILKTKSQTKKIANHLSGSTVRETCRQIWEFCFNHFQYEKDEKRKEQIRTPNRSWYDRTSIRGIDCDCFSTLIGSILTNLNIPFVMRLARYKGADFEHIYPVAFDEEGKEVIIDAVVYEFDYEVAIPPQGQLKDVVMDLEILNGVDNRPFTNDLPIDAEGLFWDDDQDLDGVFDRLKEKRAARKSIPKTERKANRKANRKQFIDDFKKGNLKEKLRAGFHVINKANPASMLLRGGVLASMKLNLFKVASHLRFAYWTVEQARANDMDLAKFNQLQRIREKVEKIYYRAGGKPASLKKAILSGKGNRNKMVSLNGLGGVPSIVADQADLRTILGDDLYLGELGGLEGLGGLGEVATAAAVTAASGAMGIIAGLIKKLGNLFKKGSRGEQKFRIQDNGDNADEKTRKFSFKNLANKVRTKIQERRERRKARESDAIEDEEAIVFENDEQFDIPEEEYIPIPENEYLPQNSLVDQDDDTDGSVDNGESDSGGDADAPKKETGGMMNWIKNNKGLSIGIGVGSLAAIGGTIWGIKAYRKSKVKKKSNKSMNGVPKKKKTSKAKTTRAKPTPKKRKPRVNKSGTRAKAPIKKLREIKLS